MDNLKTGSWFNLLLIFFSNAIILLFYRDYAYGARYVQFIHLLYFLLFPCSLDSLYHGHPTIQKKSWGMSTDRRLIREKKKQEWEHNKRHQKKGGSMKNKMPRFLRMNQTSKDEMKWNEKKKKLLRTEKRERMHCWPGPLVPSGFPGLIPPNSPLVL